MLTLYSSPLSANGRKALAVARHLEIPLAVEIVDVYAGEGRAPEYLAKNPWGKIPTLVDDELILWESNAILMYFAEGYGDFRLTSRNATRRADIARWLFWESTAWQPAFIEVLASFVGRRVVPQLATLPDEEVCWGDERFRMVTTFVDGHLAGRDFLVGDTLTIADFSLAGMMTYMRAAKFPFDLFPNLARWYARVEATPAWCATAAGPWR